MAKGRRGFILEGLKFGVYLIIPIFASYYFSDPKRQKESADYWQYVKYPSNPTVGIKEKVEQLVKQKKQHQAYMDQLKVLNEQASRVEASKGVNLDDATSFNKKSWLNWIGFGPSQSN